MTSVRHVLSTTVFFRKVTRDRCFGRAQWAIWDQDLPCFKNGGFDRHAHEVKKEPQKEVQKKESQQKLEKKSHPEVKKDLPKPRRKTKTKPKQVNTDSHFPLPPPPPKVISYLKPVRESSETSTVPTDMDSTLALSPPSFVKTEDDSTSCLVERRTSPVCEESETRPASGPSASISSSVIDSDDEEVDQLDSDEYDDVYVAPPTSASLLPRQVTAPTSTKTVHAKVKVSKAKRVSFAGFAEDEDWSAGREQSATVSITISFLRFQCV